MYTSGREHGQQAIDDPTGRKHAKCPDSARPLPLPHANSHGKDRVSANRRAVSSNQASVRRGSGAVHEIALPLLQKRRRLAGRQQSEGDFAVNRQQSAPLPETLGIIVREYLKSLPERPLIWREPRSTKVEAMSKCATSHGRTTKIRG